MMGLPLTGRVDHATRRLAERIATGVALACAVTVIILHGHACTGDGCLFCLAAHVAQALLCVSCGLAVVLPRLTSLAVCLGRGLVALAVQTMCALAATVVLLEARTPVTDGIKLLI